MSTFSLEKRSGHREEGWKGYFMGNLLTMFVVRPGTALTWSLKIVELIGGKEKRDEVAGPMMLSEALMESLKGGGE